MLPTPHYDKLLLDLYRSAVDPDGLDAFLRGLCAATNSHIGALQRQSTANVEGNVSCIVGVDLSEVAHYEHYAPQNVWFARMGHLITPGSAHFGDDWVSLPELKRTDFYNDFLRQVDVEHTLGIYIGNHSGITTFISPCRSERVGPYGADERSFVQRITPHVVNAFALRGAWDTSQRQLDATGRSRRAVFWLDGELRWLGGNTAAEHVVSSGWWHGRRNGRLAPAHSATAAAWRLALHEVATGAPTHASPMPVMDASGRIVAFARLHACGASLTAPCELPHFVLFVCPIRGNDHAELISQLKALFQLTKAEATLTAVLRATGSLELAATRMGISKTGARTRLQSVFDKTNTHSQIDLIRMTDALAEICE